MQLGSNMLNFRLTRGVQNFYREESVDENQLIPLIVVHKDNHLHLLYSFKYFKKIIVFL